MHQNAETRRAPIGKEVGLPFKLIEAAAAGDIELVTSPPLVEELHNVLGRAHLVSRLLQQRSTVEQAAALYGELTISVSPLKTPRIVADDIDDDHVIAAAVAATHRSACSIGHYGRHPRT